VYQRTRAHLARELGLEPGPALQAMQEQILRQAPEIDAGNGVAVWAGSVEADERRMREERLVGPPVAPTPTIGRKREIEGARVA
jgi:DNA-binding SARP family transcriptional activator